MENQNTINEEKGNDVNNVLEAGRAHITIEFDENDHNGNSRGRVSQCIIGEMILESKFFEGCDFEACHYQDMPAFKIEGKIFPALSYIPYTGNIIWNTYKTTEYYALLLINWLIKSKNWSVTEAPTAQYDKFNGGEDFDRSDLQACF